MKLLLRRYGDVLMACGLALIFTFWPELDLSVAAYFYQPGVGFPTDHLWWVKLIYDIVSKLWMLVFVWLLLLVLGFVPRFKAHWAPRRKMVGFLLAVLLIGPGIIVHSVLKDHWDRARPVQVKQFGGKAEFTPALLPSNQCDHNCSFVSGHAAAGFYPIVGYWLTRRRRWLVGGIGLGLLVGYIRMAMGGHFLSDILFAGLIVHFTCRTLAYFFRFPIAAIKPRAVAAM